MDHGTGIGMLTRSIGCPFEIPEVLPLRKWVWSWVQKVGGWPRTWRGVSGCTATTPGRQCPTHRRGPVMNDAFAVDTALGMGQAVLRLLFFDLRTQEMKTSDHTLHISSPTNFSKSKHSRRATKRLTITAVEITGFGFQGLP